MRRLLPWCLALLPVSGPALAGPPRLAPVTPALRVEVGRPHYLGFRLDRPAERTLQLAARCPDGARLRLQPELTIERGRRLGFLRMDPLKTGQARVEVAGAVCRVTVVDQALRPAVAILTPADGAVLWGDVALRVRALGQSPIRSIEWRLDGRVFYRGGPGQLDGRLSAEGKPGRHLLEARAIDAAGRVGVAAHRVIFAGPKLGDPRRHLTIEAESMGPARRVGGIAPQPPAMRGDRRASGGRVASSYATAQLLQYPLTIPETGYYQLVLRARGDAYLASPAVAIYVDQRTNPPAAIGPITATGRYERHAVGLPFQLTRGKRLLSVYFYNDAYDPTTRSDRNLHTDRLELRHLGARRPDCLPPRVVLVSDAVGDQTGGSLALWASARDEDRVARMALTVDGVVVARGTAQELTHELPPDALRPGTHTVRAIAWDAAGNVGRSRPLVVQRLPYQGVAPERLRLIAAQGKGPQELEPYTDARAYGGRVWGLYSSGVPITFPVRIRRAGRYAVQLHGRADLYQGPPIARISARSNGEVVSSVQIAVTSPVHALSAAGTLSLSHGEYQLVVEFVNDKYDGSAETDRNLHLAGLRLWRRGSDREAPWAEIVAPSEGARLLGTELIVARASDNDEVALVELLVDGRPISRAAGSGRVPLWLHAQRLTAGPHTLQVRVTDRQGNVGLSGPRRISLRHASADAPLSRTERGIHLLRRLGLGHNPIDLAELMVTGEAAWLAAQLSPDPARDAFADYWEAELNRNNLFNHGQLRAAVTAHALYTRYPVRERLAHFFDNHFSTWIGKTGVLREWQELATFRALSLGRFRNLLLASAASPTMLVYLDNTENRKNSLNENYAREILELHTLGVHGGYTQQDVEQISRIFTGWTATQGFPWYHFAYSAIHHDTGEKRALGTRFSGGRAGEDAVRLIGILCAHPSTARFVSRKLLAWLVADDPPERLVRRTARRFLATGGDIKLVLEGLLADPEFHARRHLAGKVTDPFEFVVGIARGRTTGFDYYPLVRAMDRMGRPLFGRVTPDGFPERGAEWLNGATLLVRWNFAERAARRLTHGMPTGPYAAGRTLGELIDDLSLSLLGRPLTARSREVVRAAFAGKRGFDTQKQTRAVAALILQMPEAQRN